MVPQLVSGLVPRRQRTFPRLTTAWAPQCRRRGTLVPTAARRSAEQSRRHYRPTPRPLARNWNDSAVLARGRGARGNGDKSPLILAELAYRNTSRPAVRAWSWGRRWPAPRQSPTSTALPDCQRPNQHAIHHGHRQNLSLIQDTQPGDIDHRGIARSGGKEVFFIGATTVNCKHLSQWQAGSLWDRAPPAQMSPGQADPAPFFTSRMATASGRVTPPRSPPQSHLLPPRQVPCIQVGEKGRLGNAALTGDVPSRDLQERPLRAALRSSFLSPKKHSHQALGERSPSKGDRLTRRAWCRQFLRSTSLLVKRAVRTDPPSPYRYSNRREVSSSAGRLTVIWLGHVEHDWSTCSGHESNSIRAWKAHADGRPGMVSTPTAACSKWEKSLTAISSPNV